MEERYIGSDTEQLLKDIGFLPMSCTTQSVVTKWLREMHGLYVTCEWGRKPDGKGVRWRYFIENLRGSEFDDPLVGLDMFPTSSYEESLEEGIKAAAKFLKKNIGVDMNKHVLTVEEMQHLQEMGVELKPTLLCYKRNKLLDDAAWFLDVRIDRSSHVFEEIPAYTLQDILDILPKVLFDTEFRNKCWLEISTRHDNCWYLAYGYESCIHKENLIDAAYDALCYAVEHGFAHV